MKKIISLFLAFSIIISSNIIFGFNSFSTDIMYAEPNETKNTSTLLSVGDTYYGEIGSYSLYQQTGTTDVDYFKFELEKDDRYVIILSNFSTFLKNTSISVTLINPIGNEFDIKYEFEFNPDSDIDYLPFEAAYSGTYYLKLANYCDTSLKTSHYYSVSLTTPCGYFGHDYGTFVMNPTKTELGYHFYMCLDCWNTIKDEHGNVYKDNFTAPTGKLTLKHSARTANAIKVQWNKVATATGYQVQISNAAGNAWGKAYVTTANTYLFKNLAAGNNYKFRVRFYIKAADGKNYFSPWSATLTSPTLPAGTSITKLTPAKRAFTAQWKKNAAVNGYQIQYGLKSNFSGAKILTLKSPNTLKATMKSLSAKKVYYVRIRTFKTISKVNYYSTWSNTYKVKTK